MADGVRGKRSRQVPSGFPLMQGTLLPTWPWGEGQSWEEEGVSGAGDPGPVLAVPLYATTYTRPPGLLQESGRCQKPGLGLGRECLFSLKELPVVQCHQRKEQARNGPQKASIKM